MISDRKALRMAISPLRSREYWLSGLWQAVALAIAVLLLQRLVEVWILSFAQLNHAYFPLPLVAAGEEIAGWKRGLGVGLFYNEEAGPRAVSTFVGVVVLYFACKVFHLLFLMIPNMLFAGALANKFEALLFGHVFDWIVVPHGERDIWALSVGDLLIIGGLVLYGYRLTFGLSNSLVRSVARINQYIRDPDLKWQLKVE